jgi:hypothetical protein
MNPNAKNEWSSGSLENAAKCVDSVATDCSCWESDIPADLWSIGKLVGVAQSIPPVVVDCSHWERAAGPRSQGKFVGVAEKLPPVEGIFVPAPPAWLELVVSFDQSTPPARAIEHTNRLIVAAARAAPELGLFYDAGRSRVEQDNVVIALSPTRTGDVEKRLNEVAAALQHETTGLRRLVATVARGRAA